MENRKKARQHKVTMIGSVAVGKTSLAWVFCKGTAKIESETTIAADWFQKSVMVGDKRVNLQIWDTAGQERFRTILPMFIRGSEAVLLVYDVTDEESFTSLTAWLDLLKTNLSGAVIKLIANKVDLPERIISTEDGENFAGENGLQYAETSAITGYNVDNVFNDLAKHIAEASTGVDNENRELIKLTNDVTSKKNNCPC